MKRTLFSLVALLMLVTVSAFAQSVPSLMNFQGRLAKPDGTAVSDGLYAAVFSIYDAPTGGNLLWSQVFTGVKTRYGVFTIALGDMTGAQGAIAPSGPLNESLLAGNRWLQIQLGGTPGPLMPRQQFLPTAFAFLANTVPDGAITTAKIADGAITAAKLAPGVGGGASGMAGGDLTGTYPNPLIALNAVTSGKLADGAVTTPKIADGSITLSKLASGLLDFSNISGQLTGNQIGGAITLSGVSNGLLTQTQQTVNHPILVGTATTGDYPISTAVLGNYAYVVNYSGKTLQVFDVSNPVSPVLKATIGMDYSPLSVAVQGNYVYVVGYSNTLQIFDVSNPVNPISKGKVVTNTAPRSIALAGNYAYVVSQGPYNSDTGYDSSSLQVFDVSNSINISLKGSVRTDGNPASIAVVGGYAYVVGGGFQVFDVNNPTAPTLKSIPVTPGNGVSIAVAGNYAYVAGNGFQVIDVSNPISPIPEVSLDTNGGSVTVAVQGNIAYVINDGGNYGGNNVIGSNLQLFDVSNPTSPTPVGSVGTDYFPKSVSVQGGYAYVVNENSNTLQVFSTSTSVVGQLQIHGGLSVMGYTGIGTTTPAYNLDVAGFIHANSIVNSSDARYKTNVATLNNALDDVLNLRGVTYDWDRTKWPNKNFPEGKQIGFIAQELEKVFPELVQTDKDGYKSVMYQNVTPVLVEAVKTLKAQVDAQKREIDELKADNAALKRQNERINALEKQLAALLEALKQKQDAPK